MKLFIIVHYFKGYREDDDDVEIVMEVEVNESKEEFTDFYWLVQKSLKVYEGELECLGSGRRKNCYEAKRKRRIGKSKNGNRIYELILQIDTLTREDIENKMFLIKDYREYNSKEDKIKAIVVPKSRRDRSLDFELDEEALCFDYNPPAGSNMTLIMDPISTLIIVATMEEQSDGKVYMQSGWQWHSLATTTTAG